VSDRKKRLFSILGSLLSIATFTKASLAAFPSPGEDLHERYILSFGSNEPSNYSCKANISTDNLRLTEILRRRVGADIAEKHYTKAIAFCLLLSLALRHHQLSARSLKLL
jgi:hypothetical protein